MNKTIEPELLKNEDLSNNYFIGFRTDLGIKFVYLLENKKIKLKDTIEEGISVFQKYDANSDTIFHSIKSKMPKG